MGTPFLNTPKSEFPQNMQLIAAAINIALFSCITLLCGTDNIPRNIPRFQSEYGEYFVEYC